MLQERRHVHVKEIRRFQDRQKSTGTTGRILPVYTMYCVRNRSASTGDQSKLAETTCSFENNTPVKNDPEASFSCFSHE